MLQNNGSELPQANSDEMLSDFDRQNQHDQPSEDSNLKPQTKVEEWRQDLSGKAKLETLKFGQRTAWVVTAEHFSQQAGDYFENEIAEATNDDPEKWVFLLEGHDRDFHEINIANKVAKERGIPVEGYLVSPYQPEVLDMFLKTKGKHIPKELVIGQLAVDLSNAVGPDFNHIASQMGFSEEEIINSMRITYETKMQNPRKFSRVQRRIQNDLLDVSNIISAQVLDYKIKKYPDRPNIAIYMGADHRPLLKIKTDRLSHGFKMSESEIETMLKTQKQKSIKQSIQHMIDKFGIQIEPHNDERLAPINQIIESGTIEMPEDLKVALEGVWAENIFFTHDPKDIEVEQTRRRFLGDNSMSEFYDACFALEENVRQYEIQGTQLPTELIEQAKKQVLESAQMRATEEDTLGINEIKLISEHMDVIAKLMQELVKQENMPTENQE